MISSSLSLIGNLAIVVLGVALLVFVHEFGHFILAKLSKVRVHAFSLGFGPKLIGIKRGDTEYQIRIIPLGGFVQLAGENVNSDDRTGAPDEFISKSPLTRILIFSGGVLMNVLITIPICTVMFLIGIERSYPIIGSIPPYSAEWNSGLKEGDKIISINGKPIMTIEDYRLEMISLSRGITVTAVVERNGAELPVSITTLSSDRTGLLYSLANVVRGVEKDSPADKAGLKPNDEIVEINGISICGNSQLSQMRAQEDQKPLNIRVKRLEKDIPQIISLVVAPEKRKIPVLNIETEITQAIIQSVGEKSAAKSAGIKAGDKIVYINGITLPSTSKFQEIIKSNPEQAILIKIQRDNEEKELSVKPNVNKNGLGYIGVELLSNNVLCEIPKDSVLESAGLKVGDVILTANKKKIKELDDLKEVISGSKGDVVKIAIKRNDKKEQIDLNPLMKEQWSFGLIELSFKVVNQKYGLGKSIYYGVMEPINLFDKTLKLIWKLIKVEESPKGLAGPLGIFIVSTRVVEQGISYFLWLLALFSLNLAILNLLPIPILDGGGIMFNVIEKIKGSPVSMKVQIISQYVGLFILLSLVLFATYNDIFNFILHK